MLKSMLCAIAELLTIIKTAAAFACHFILKNSLIINRHYTRHAGLQNGDYGITAQATLGPPDSHRPIN